MKRAAAWPPLVLLSTGCLERYGATTLSSVEKIGKWLAAPMKKSMGIESQAFVREARKARRAHFGISAGAGAPLSAVAFVAAMMRFWSGQMIIHTFRNMMVPSPPPIMMDRVRLDAPTFRAMSAVA